MDAHAALQDLLTLRAFATRGCSGAVVANSASWGAADGSPWYVRADMSGVNGGSYFPSLFEEGWGRHVRDTLTPVIPSPAGRGFG
jgi:hypothetical protein